MQAEELGEATRLSSALVTALAERPVRTQAQAQTYLDTLRRKRSNFVTIDAQVWLGSCIIGLQMIHDSLIYRELFESRRRQLAARALEAAGRGEEAEASRLQRLARQSALLVAEEEDRAVLLSKRLQDRTAAATLNPARPPRPASSVTAPIKPSAPSASQASRDVGELRKSVRRLEDRALSEGEYAELALGRGRALKYMQVADPQAAPEAIVKIIDSYVERWQHEGPIARDGQSEEPDPAEVAVEVGAAWGEQFIRRFGWQWLSVRHVTGNELAVASPDRSLVVYPARFVRACLHESEIDCSVMLAFNMLAAGSVSAMPAGQFQDLMLGVRRVVPK